MQHTYYTGVGSRKTPRDVCAYMQKAARGLAQARLVLRSGGAEGADTAFETGAREFLIRSPKQLFDIYLPWDGFEGRRKGLNHHIPEDCPPLLWQKATDIAKDIHPDWKACKRGARTLHTRNMFQVLGHTLDSPSKFLVCWAPIDKHGAAKGGTATAWRLAKEHGVKCFNLNITFDQFEFDAYLKDELKVILQ